jgi:hypothetical protein
MSSSCSLLIVIDNTYKGADGKKLMINRTLITAENIKNVPAGFTCAEKPMSCSEFLAVVNNRLLAN